MGTALIRVRVRVKTLEGTIHTALARRVPYTQHWNGGYHGHSNGTKGTKDTALARRVPYTQHCNEGYHGHSTGTKGTMDTALRNFS